jgi:hypothetical protein
MNWSSHRSDQIEPSATSVEPVAKPDIYSRGGPHESNSSLSPTIFFPDQVFKCRVDDPELPL